MAVIDGRDFPESSEIDCDLCIIGSGAAGITWINAFDRVADLPIAMKGLLLCVSPLRFPLG